MLGRSGNNLFQYALGRQLSKKHGVPLLLSGSLFNEEGWASVSHLRHLPIQATLQRGWSLPSRLIAKLTHRHPWEFRPKPLYREPVLDHSFNPEVLEMPADCVLRGFFQSPLYFAGLEEELRVELSFATRRLDDESAIIAEQISTSSSVAVHVRRTDYINNLNADICTSEYYRGAMMRLQEQTPGLTFFVFSDDPAWCRAAFPAPEVRVVECSRSHVDPFNDLHLMSLAQHQVIANSSYSWWGAWLGKKPGQRVLMPSEWFRGIHSPIEEKRVGHWEIYSV